MLRRQCAVERQQLRLGLQQCAELVQQPGLSGKGTGERGPGLPELGCLLRKIAAHVLASVRDKGFKKACIKTCGRLGVNHAHSGPVLRVMGVNPRPKGIQYRIHDAQGLRAICGRNRMGGFDLNQQVLRIQRA